MGFHFNSSGFTHTKPIRFHWKVIEIPDEPEKSPVTESKEEVAAAGGKEEKETEAVSREAAKEKEVKEEKKTSATEKETSPEVKGEESHGKNNEGESVC